MINRKVLIHLVVITTGAGIILLSLFAFQLRLDNNPAWGPRRFQFLVMGIAVVLFGALYWISPILSRWTDASLKPALANSLFGRWVKRSAQKATLLNQSIVDSQTMRNVREASWFSWVSKIGINSLYVLIIGVVLWAYVWVISIGRMDKWPVGRNYYWLLTQAFEHGQTSLLVKPSPELLKLQNPYDLNQRRELDYLWDISLYKGNYYLYWGPVPAVIGVLFNLITSKPITDAGLVFFFGMGTALFSVLLLRKLYQDSRFSTGVFYGGVIALLMNVPLIWLFTHPAYYEASIAGGQFFMMAGFFLLYLALQSSVHKGYLLLSALAFGLAGGTRINLLSSVVFLASMILWRIYMLQNRKLHSSASGFAIVLIPLAIVALSLCWYNYVRFGSIFEFGHRYQLTGLAGTESSKDQLSFRYMIPNVYSYVFRPPSFRDKFPFITILSIKQNMWPVFIHPPQNYYYAEPVAGILFTVPLICFAVLLLLRLFWLFVNGDVAFQKSAALPGMFNWFMFSLVGYIVIQTALLFVFISSSLRYLFDVTPALIVFSTVFAGVYIRSFEKKPVWVKSIVYLWNLAAVLTVISGFLIGITGGENNFLNKNPHLYYQIAQWFSR